MRHGIHRTIALLVTVVTSSLILRSDLHGQEQPVAQNTSQVPVTGNADAAAFRDQIVNSPQGMIAPGTYDFHETVDLDLSELGPVSIRSNGPVTIRMHSEGPAIRIRGSLTGSASPKQISESTWLERMPMIEGISIIGAGPQSDGIELVGTMQAVIRAIQIRHARHGILLRKRNRNLNVSNVHLYDNSGVGLWLDDVNLHQMNVSNSHISYNRGGGILVRGGNVRNLHITGCDIEANMTDDQSPTSAANVMIDSSETGSIAEVAITGNTIQHSAHYGDGNLAPGGANIRILGRSDFIPNMITITGNVLSDTETHLHLRRVSDTTIVGNTFFTTEPTDVLIEACQGIALANNVLNPRESKQTGQVLIVDSSLCSISGLVCRNLLASEAAITLRNCRDSMISHCVISGSNIGIRLEQCTDCFIRDCLIADDTSPARSELQGDSRETSP